MGSSSNESVQVVMEPPRKRTKENPITVHFMDTNYQLNQGVKEEDIDEEFIDCLTDELVDEPVYMENIPHMKKLTSPVGIQSLKKWWDESEKDGQVRDPRSNDVGYTRDEWKLVYDDQLIERILVWLNDNATAEKEGNHLSIPFYFTMIV